MKKTALILAFMLVMLNISALAAEPYDWLHVSGCDEWISLRSMPSKDAHRIAKIPLGAIVTYISEANDEFMEIQYAGMRGYALRSYLTEYAPLTGFDFENYSPVMYLRGNKAPLYSVPDMDGEPIAMLSKDERVVCIGIIGGDDSDAAFVRYGEMTGYMPLSGLSFLRDSGTPVITGAVMLLPGSDGEIITQHIACSTFTKSGEFVEAPYSEEQVNFHHSEIAAMLDRVEPGITGQCPLGALLILSLDDDGEDRFLRFMLPLDGCATLIAENHTVFQLSERDGARLWEIFGNAWKDNFTNGE